MPKRSLINPTEKEEYPAIAEYLDLMKFVYTHTAQSTFTSFKQINALKKAGVRKGLPDYIIILPYWYVKHHTNIILFAEIKRRNGVPSDTSPEQKEWITQLNMVEGVLAKVFYGSSELIDFIDKFDIKKVSLDK